MKNCKCNYATRPSEFTDVNIVAWTVLTALDIDTNDMFRVIESCSDEMSMYSWKNSIVACDGDEVIGCIICYEGGINMIYSGNTHGEICGMILMKIL